MGPGRTSRAWYFHSPVSQLNPFELRLAKTLWSFGQSECKRVIKNRNSVSLSKMLTWESTVQLLVEKHLMLLLFFVSYVMETSMKTVKNHVRKHTPSLQLSITA